MQHEPVIVYTTQWCGDCRAVKRALQQKGVAYVEVDIDRDTAAGDRVEQINGGRRSVPTLVHGQTSVSLSRFSLEKLHEFLSGSGLAARS